MSLFFKAFVCSASVAQAFVMVGRTGSHRQQRSSMDPLFAATTYQHALAILNMPVSSRDRIANEAVIEAIFPETNKLSVVLRCPSHTSTAALRRYVGEMYSLLWDVSVYSSSSDQMNIPDAIVYPQNLPNAAPESWIAIQEDLDCVCGLSSTIGWSSESLQATVEPVCTTSGMGGLEAHVSNINLERQSRGLSHVEALPVDSIITQSLSNDPNVIFVDDDDNQENADPNNNEEVAGFLAGAQTDPEHVVDSVCVGGTFDGLHYGHRKLLTLAVSSVTPVTGRLYVGVTADEMLKHKAFAEYIPDCATRMASVRAFLNRLAPGMIDRVRIQPIEDAYGPAGKPNEEFDALVLSHETLPTGQLLNQHRTQTLKLPALRLLCTQRTEAHGMSSTALRRLRSQQQRLAV